MDRVRNNGFSNAVHDYERDAATETIRQLLEQTERLAREADLTEVAFLIGVALASLGPENCTANDSDFSFGAGSRLM